MKRLRYENTKQVKRVRKLVEILTLVVTDDLVCDISCAPVSVKHCILSYCELENTCINELI